MRLAQSQTHQPFPGILRARFLPARRLENNPPKSGTIMLIEYTNYRRGGTIPWKTVAAEKGKLR